MRRCVRLTRTAASNAILRQTREMFGNVERFDAPTIAAVCAGQNIYRPQLELRLDSGKTIDDREDHAAMRDQQGMNVVRQGHRRAVDRYHAVTAAPDARGEFGAAFAARISIIRRQPIALPARKFLGIALLDLLRRETLEEAE